ncbi:MAG: 4Fe-4S binding protein [Firmicutes bacterium]|nr:4Fe-4S binding protein [Bacillota bacterium]
MGNVVQAIKKHHRHLVQIIFTAVSNGYWQGFVTGKIFAGDSKFVCFPGLYCYSCPGALGACPIGSLQATLTSYQYKMALYAVGFLFIFGAVLGRFICGWLCPFGLVQDLLHKIPFPMKLKKLPGEKALRWLKYGILVLFVILLPSLISDAFGQGSPWFCKYICPSGTLFAGLPMLAADETLRMSVGGLFALKLTILIVLIVLSMMLWRPFCRYLCPLGAIYSFFNPVALYRIRIDESKCVKCGTCQRTCKMELPVYKKPNNMECIRCGACKQACPEGAISMGLCLHDQKKKPETAN